MSDPAPVAQRYTLPVERGDAEVVAATLWAAGATGVWERPGELVAWFPDRDVAGLPPGGRFDDEPDRDWQAEWKATIGPVHAGRFAIVPTWSADDHHAAPGEVTVVLDPGRAFGSGHHATTTGCLDLLDALDRRTPLTGRTVADIGCGSGVLAIAAARLGAQAVGSDIDPEAVAVTAENAARNGVEVPAVVGSVAAATGLLGGPPDVVLANLVTDTLAELATELVGALAVHGVLIASGIAADRADVALGPLRDAGLVIDERRDRDGWVAIRGSRRASTGRTTGPAADAVAAPERRYAR